MDRRRTALVLLLLFVGCLGVAIVLSGSRPALQQGIGAGFVQLIGEVAILVATVRLALGVAADRRVR